MSKKKMKPKLLIIEMPLEGFSPEKLDNLKKLVESKATLIKKAIGTEDLPIQILEDRIAFPWFSPGAPAEEIQAYSQLIAALCVTAKKKVRVVARPQEVFENEKFAMRVFGIGLGLVGSEYALCRKFMSRNLPDTLEKLALLAGQKEERISRNMLIESIIEDFVRAAFPAAEPGEANPPVEVPEAAKTALNET